MHQEDEYIELKFGPHWNYIAAARGFLQNFLAISKSNQEFADKMAMAASELLENAVKYSKDSETHMFVAVNKKTGKVKVTVSNQSDEEQCDELKQIYKKIMQKTPLEAYVDQMKEAAVREDGKSQLGLVRIRYEVGADITVNINEDNYVSIILEK